MTVPFRNPRLIRDGAIECEINHPAMGWIPFGAVANESGLSGQVFAAALPRAIDARRPPSATPPVPDTASRFQARMALRNAGLFDAAEAAVRDSGDALLQEAWDSATEFRRASPAIQTLGAALGLDAAALDQLFRDAAQITA